MFKPKKRKFFEQKIDDVTKSLWELEFKIDKARGMREQSRQARDRAVEVLGGLEKLYKENPLEETKGKIEQAKAQVTGFEAQMQMVDDQINGSGDQKGLLEYMEGLAELKVMYREYVKKT